MAKGEFKIHKSKGYTWMSNRHFHEKEMSFKAKGLLSFMFSVAELAEKGDWDHSISGLAATSSDGKKAVRSALQELENFGYLYREVLYPEKNKRNSIEYFYHVFETPEECKSYKLLKRAEKEHRRQDKNKSKSVQKVHTPNGNADVKPSEIAEVGSDTKMGTLPKRNKSINSINSNESVKSVQKVRLPKVYAPKEYAPEEYADEVYTQKDTQINTKESNNNKLNTKEINTNQSINPSNKPNYDFWEKWIKENVEYDFLVTNNTNKEKKEHYKKIVYLIIDVMAMDKGSFLKINGEYIPVSRVQKIFLNFNANYIMEIEDKFIHANGNIKNPRNYLISMLYNEYFTSDISLTIAIVPFTHL